MDIHVCNEFVRDRGTVVYTFVISSILLTQGEAAFTFNVVHLVMFLLKTRFPLSTGLCSFCESGCPVCRRVRKNAVCSDLFRTNTSPRVYVSAAFTGDITAIGIDFHLSLAELQCSIQGCERVRRKGRVKPVEQYRRVASNYQPHTFQHNTSSEYFSLDDSFQELFQK